MRSYTCFITFKYLTYSKTLCQHDIIILGTELKSKNV